MKCAWKRCNNETDGNKYCSRKCCTKQHTTLNRLKFKSKAVELKGGKCSKCGYNKCLRGLQFHHLDPSKKSFTLSRGNNISWERFKAELDKCILLCANCHAEVEAGL